MAEAVGPGGTVYAVDVDAGLNKYVEKKAARKDLTQIKTVLAEFGDPLVLEKVDLIFTSNTYHHFTDPTSYFANALKYLQPDGRVAIIDYNQSPSIFVKKHFVNKDQVIAEMEQGGYVLDQDHSFLPKQVFLVFSKAR